MSFDPREFHLTSWQEVCEHLDDTRRWSRYRALLDDFGIDPCVVDPGSQRPPQFLYAEHPGNWMYPTDLVRVTLARALAERQGLEPQVLQFENDVFRKNGLKRFFSKWCLHPLLPWVSLVRPKDVRSTLGARTHRDASEGFAKVHDRAPHGASKRLEEQCWHRRVYASIQLQGPSRQALIDKLSMALQLIQTVADGELPLALLNSACSPPAREVVGGPWSRAATHRLVDALRKCDLQRAQAPLQVGLAALRQPISWANLWQRINTVFLGQTVGRIDPIFEGFLLAIRDPLRMADRLAQVCGDERVTVAGFVEDQEFRLVQFDRDRRVFLAFTSTGDTQGREIEWSMLRELAAQGRGATPSATVEYLMMAATGHFVVSDPYDGQTAFERRVAKLHAEGIGRRFPWVSLQEPNTGEHAGSYLGCYDDGLENYAQQTIARQFFDEDSP